MATKWLYKIIYLQTEYDDAQKTFNNLGNEGWELVSIIHHNKAQAFLEPFLQSEKSDYLAFFKKPEQD